MSLLIHQGALAFQHWFPGKDALPFMRKSMMDGSLKADSAV
jgi:shikimate 5-dehydrogenase